MFFRQPSPPLPSPHTLKITFFACGRPFTTLDHRPIYMMFLPLEVGWKIEKFISPLSKCNSVSYAMPQIFMVHAPPPRSPGCTDVDVAEWSPEEGNCV